MTDLPLRPIECLLPLIGVIVGMGFGVAFVLLLPSEWEQGFKSIWFPRWLGIIASLILWSGFTIYRGKRLHCGGTKPISSSDKQKYLFGFFGTLISYTGLIFAYANASTLIFVLIVFLFITVFLSEVGWGNPLHAFNALSRKT